MLALCYKEHYQIWKKSLPVSTFFSRLRCMSCLLIPFNHIKSIDHGSHIPVPMCLYNQVYSIFPYLLFTQPNHPLSIHSPCRRAEENPSSLDDHQSKTYTRPTKPLLSTKSLPPQKKMSPSSLIKVSFVLFLNSYKTNQTYKHSFI